MADREKIEQSLRNIIDNIGEFENGDIDWYSGQIALSDDEDSDDDYRSIDQRLMTEAFKYPELHPLMREAVKTITETNASEGEVWDQDEEHAGTNAALLLAMENKNDIPLYAYFIATNDLNHPVYQEEDWCDLFHQWEPCEETLLLLIAVSLVPGQWFGLDAYWENHAKWIKENNSIDSYFKQLHFFVVEANRLDLPFCDVEEFLQEKLPELLSDNIVSDEALVKHIVEQFIEYPEVPEPPTLELLTQGYNK